MAALLDGDLRQLRAVLRKSLVSMFLHSGWLHSAQGLTGLSLEQA